MEVTTSGFERVEAKLTGFFDGMAEDLQGAGDAMAEQIVATTLQGQGVDDAPFAPYSASYQKLLDALGGKPGDVDLRGIVAGDGAPTGRRSKSARPARGSRRVRVTAGGKTYTGRMSARPRAGLTDPQSEMSLDLITVETTSRTITITYNPRNKSYMLTHQEGDGKMPQRMWFTARKAAVEQALGDHLQAAIARRAAAFNNG
jgi:hypothetical protein